MERGTYIAMHQRLKQNDIPESRYIVFVSWLIARYLSATAVRRERRERRGGARSEFPTLR